jgi:hypothetical protein
MFPALHRTVELPMNSPLEIPPLRGILLETGVFMRINAAVIKRTFAVLALLCSTTFPALAGESEQSVALYNSAKMWSPVNFNYDVIQTSAASTSSTANPARDLLAEDEQHQKRVKALRSQSISHPSETTKTVAVRNTSQATLKNYERACRDLGWVPNTGGFATCVERRIYDNTPSTPPQQIKPIPSTTLNITQASLKNYERACRDLGWVPNTGGFATCVERRIYDNTPSTPSQQIKPIPSTTVNITQATLSPNEQTCVGYGFKKQTTQFGQCLMQLDVAQRQAQLQQQQYELQLAQYQQQVASYNAQQAAIKREKNRRQGEALMRMSQGVLNSRSPSLLGNIADGFAAVNEAPIPQPVLPTPPISQNYTVRMPNGNQVYCNYNSALGYMSCR